MRSFQLTRLATIILLGCDPTVTSEEDQGIRGTVIKYVGNFQCCNEDGEAFPLSVPVHIIRGTVDHQSTAPPPTLEGLALELTVHSDSDGRFEATLAPGTYTVLAEIDGELYLNCHEALPEGEQFCSVVVEELEFTEFDIAETSGAGY